MSDKDRQIVMAVAEEVLEILSQHPGVFEQLENGKVCWPAIRIA